MDIQRIKETFEKQGAFVIVVGQTYTIDEMGSALSIYLTLTSQGKNVSIISAKQPLVEVSNLVGIDQVKPTFESKSGDLVVSFPYQNDEIGKVSYTLESGLLNIIVKPKDVPLSFGEKDVIFKRTGDAPEVIITVGVKRISELQAFFDVQALKDTTIVNIDKVGNNEGFGDIVVIGQSASSVSEQVANLMITLAYPMDPDVAQNLMSGVISSTGNFQNPRTSSLAFEMAGILLRSGAKREAPRVAAPQQPRQPVRPANPFRPVPMAQPQPRSQQPSAPTQIREFPREQKKDEAPPDWLTPKIFKGSTSVE